MKKTLIPAFFIVLSLIVLSGCGNGGNGNTSGSGGSSGGGSTGSGGATPQNTVLDGQYAFSLTGSTSASGVPIFMAGSFKADGAGNITAGEEDINQINANGTATLTKGTAVTGNYSIGSDGRGTLNFTTGVTQTFKFAIENGGHGQIIRFDSGATASGTFDLQTAAAFSLSSLSGNYAFNWSGADDNLNPVSAVGAFSLASSGAASAGAVDLNEGTVGYSQGTVSGTLHAPDSNGHGTATITYGTNTLTYGYDVVTATRILLIELDSTAGTVGEADAQTATFTASSFSGNYAFLLGGVNTTSAIGIVGQIATASGSITSSDAAENDGGTVPVGTTFAGSYAFAPTVASVNVNGRFSMSAVEPAGFADSFVFYLVSPSEAFAMEIDADQITSGEFLTQTGGPYMSSSFSGNYGLNFSGINLSAQEAGAEIDVVGQITAGANSTLTGGTIDINDEGASPSTLPNNAISGGNYAVETSAGRSTLSFTAAQAPFGFFFYFVSPNQVFLLEDDTNFISFGAALSQPAIP
jgi:hypothetical protein